VDTWRFDRYHLAAPGVDSSARACGPTSVRMRSSSPPTTPPGGWTMIAWQVLSPSGYSAFCTRSGPKCVRRIRRVLSPSRWKPSSSVASRWFAGWLAGSTGRRSMRSVMRVRREVEGRPGRSGCSGAKADELFQHCNKCTNKVRADCDRFLHIDGAFIAAMHHFVALRGGLRQQCRPNGQHADARSEEGLRKSKKSDDPARARERLSSRGCADRTE